ncbi:hypothetical protein ASPZODRAFT_57517 [Penicilliopsis zonata CBS 506.65]|uniref:Uncharacterized protein n=1 Tax=Penicilliopsis zonata CBS 506.65 TaxID=1073090 RepID=A0A1L9SWI2_9EURO|nr:hypothetical protein ASPZODRAFT_57517 [Penicilliopsis zonata CBS 506.65]OJJ51555.1 hypothetical protein ASPZODRAFT_57517 [Penicilliopsis zonata CBS 506.65]
MALRMSADRAEDVAAGFRLFRDPLPEHATEITSLMADLFAISSLLKIIEDLLRSPLYRRQQVLVRADVELVRASLDYTLEDILRFFAAVDQRSSSDRETFKRAWLELCTFFRTEAQSALSPRLGRYKLFLRDLEDLTRGKPFDPTPMAGLRSSLQALLAEQDKGLATRIGAIDLGRYNPSSSSSNIADQGSPRRPRGRRSYERTRPNNHTTTTTSNYYHPQHSPQSPLSPLSPSSLTFSSDSAIFPPSAPEAPDSPPTSSATGRSLGSSNMSEHWAKKVFDDNHSATRIPFVGESSKCFGEPKQGLRSWLRDSGFEELFQLIFDGEQQLRVYLYSREDDHRARIMCKSVRASRPSEYFCMPLNMLEIYRVGSCLQLCRRRNAGSELELWANLKFHTIERMVLFFCTILALRSQDNGRPVERIRDYELEREEELFGGQIMDDSYLHALRIYRDTVSGAVRLQASILRGEMKRTPVWTAFITHHASSRAWIRREDSNVVLLGDLRRAIFASPDYSPPRTSRGEHILKFTTKDDADSFMETIAEVAEL